MNRLITALFVVLASAAVTPALANEANFTVISEGTTRTNDDNNICPKTYTFTFTMQATSPGPYSYQFVRSDGARGPLVEYWTGTGTVLHPTYTWELGSSVTDAWVGISINNAPEIHLSTFTLVCDHHEHPGHPGHPEHP